MLQLRTGTTPVENRAECEPGEHRATRVCGEGRCSATGRTLEARPGVHALGHEDRLEHVIGHLVQNALDATQPRRRSVAFASARAASTRCSRSPTTAWA